MGFTEAWATENQFEQYLAGETVVAALAVWMRVTDTCAEALWKCDRAAFMSASSAARVNNQTGDFVLSLPCLALLECIRNCCNGGNSTI